MSDNHFDPSRYLKKVNGNDYLEVKWRLVWLRNNEPNATIETELISLTDQQAVFKATVTIPAGARATGFGSETPRDFGDFIEKAETKAVGRALGMLGYGTQFSYEFEEGERIVDSPTNNPQQNNLPPRQHNTSQNTVPPQQNGHAPGPQGGATPKQIGFIESLGRDKGFSVVDLNEASDATYGVEYAKLNRRDASSFIEWLTSRPAREQPATEQDPMFARDPDRFTR